MPNSFGYRAQTRSLFKKGFRQHGQIALTKVQRVYRIGDIVDIKADGGVHKGMPHKFYHGKTGTVFNVSRRAVGVIVTKRVRGRIINKRVYIRIEHLKPSNSRKEFLERVKLNAQKRKAGGTYSNSTVMWNVLRTCLAPLISSLPFFIYGAVEST